MAEMSSTIIYCFYQNCAIQITHISNFQISMSVNPIPANTMQPAIIWSMVTAVPVMVQAFLELNVKLASDTITINLNLMKDKVINTYLCCFYKSLQINKY